ncbi:putative disease resistance protein RGA1 [Bienertia sinuspersici]
MKMAAEAVMLDNLTTMLNNNDNESLLPCSWVELENWRESVQWARQMLEAVEEGDAIRSNNNLATLVYEADDLLDKILTFIYATRSNNHSTQQIIADQGAILRAAIKRVTKATSNVTHEVSLFFSPRNQLVLHLVLARQLNKTSKRIIELGNQFFTELNTNDAPQLEVQFRQSFQLAEDQVIGRDRDREDIIKTMFQQPKKDCKTNVSVLPIYGLPGVGKSTLAKYVYNNEKVKNHFDLRMWIRISHIFDEAEVIREIVKSFSRRNSGFASSSKHFCAKQNNGGLPFGDLFKCQSMGTSAIAPNCSTTRRNESNINERRLQKEIEGKLYLLVLDDASLIQWQHLKNLLARGAEGSQVLVTTRESELKEMGYSIARKCKGVPLTIKVVASLLYEKRDEDNEWLSFKNELMDCMEHENTLEHVLNLSYTELPTRLKACFSYCSLFPDDYTFNKHDLVSLWNAQGFTQQQNGQRLEETAEKYFLKLSQRCFFEDVTIDDLGNIITCKMHPIMHRLACQHRAGNSSTNIAPALLQAHSLRTLISVMEPERYTKLPVLACNVLVSNLKCLRVLDLHDLGIEELPLSMGELIHLRFLDLSKNDGLFELPKSITRLYNLQTLKLNSCPKLRRLPSNFRELVNLKRFEVDECDSLTCMPLGLEKLTQLETLSRFVVSKDCSKETASIGLKALKDLNNLRGRLSVELTGDWAKNIAEASQAKLSSKTNLEELKISWAKTDSERSDYRKLLEELQPNSKLKSLRIEGYKGEYFPDWAKLGKLTLLQDLVVVSVEGCDKCEHLPPFGELKLLKKLTLRHMTSVRHIEVSAGDDNQATTSESPPFFPSLEELILHNFYKLKGWQNEVMDTSRHTKIRKFPCLTKLRIWNCPKLEYMPLFMKVEDLDLCNVNQKLLEECEKKASKEGNNTSKIKQLKIKECRNLNSFKAVREGLGGLKNLKQLVVDKCDALCSLASELKDLFSLESLEISNCKELNLSDDGFSAMVNRSWISSIIVHHPFNGVSRNPWKSLVCLRHLTLREIPKMETLPEELKHVQSLRSLWISACPAFKALPEWINQLTALQHLRIESCQSLTRLPDGLQQVTSLVKVEITECPKLMERCKEHTGEDWHKIKHARVLLHESWRYGNMSEIGASKSISNVRALSDVKYFILPVLAAVKPTKKAANHLVHKGHSRPIMTRWLAVCDDHLSLIIREDELGWLYQRS